MKNRELLNWMRDTGGRLSLALTLLYAVLIVIAAVQQGGFTPELEQKLGQYWLTGVAVCFLIFVFMLLGKLLAGVSARSRQKE